MKHFLSDPSPFMVTPLDNPPNSFDLNFELPDIVARLMRSCRTNSEFEETKGKGGKKLKSKAIVTIETLRIILTDNGKEFTEQIGIHRRKEARWHPSF